MKLALLIIVLVLTSVAHAAPKQVSTPYYALWMHVGNKSARIGFWESDLSEVRRTREYVKQSNPDKTCKYWIEMAYSKVAPLPDETTIILHM